MYLEGETLLRSVPDQEIGKGGFLSKRKLMMVDFSRASDIRDAMYYLYSSVEYREFSSALKYEFPQFSRLLWNNGWPFTVRVFRKNLNRINIAQSKSMIGFTARYLIIQIHAFKLLVLG